MKRSIAILFLFLLMSVPVFAIDRVVDCVNGNDSNPGTVAAPYRTVDFAVTQLAAGDTLYVRGGIGSYITCTVNVSIPAAVSGRRTVAPYPGELVQIQSLSGFPVVLSAARIVWDSPDLTLPQLLTLSDGTAYQSPAPPPTTTPATIKLFINNSLVMTVSGPSLSYSFLAPRGAKGQYYTIRVEVQ